MNSEAGVELEDLVKEWLRIDQVCEYRGTHRGFNTEAETWRTPRLGRRFQICGQQDVPMN